MKYKLPHFLTTIANTVRVYCFESIAVSFFILAGFLLTILIPPFQKPDEYVHFTKAVLISSGQLICHPTSKPLIPDYLQDYTEYFAAKKMDRSPGLKFDYREYVSSPFLKQEIRLVPLNNFSACVLPWLGYLPQAFGILLAKLFSLSPILTFYSGRISIFAISIIVLLLLLRKLPDHLRPITLFFFCIPMTIYQITSYSYDAVFLLAVICLFTVVLFNATQKHITWKQTLLITFLVILVLLSKNSGYELFLLLPLLLKPSSLGSNIAKISLKYALLFIVPLIMLLFFRFSVVAANVGAATWSFVNPEQQIMYLIENPGQIVRIIATTQSEQFENYLMQLIGVFGWLEYKPAFWIQVIFFVIFGALAAKGIFPQKLLSRLTLPVLSIIILGTYLIIHLAMYLTWTPVAHPVVQGVQGRYFLPLIPLLWLWLVLIIQHRVLRIILACILTACVLASLSQTVFNRYFNYRQSYNDAIAEQSSQFISSPSNKANQKQFEFSTLTDKKLIGFRIIFDQNIYESDANQNDPVAIRPLKYRLSETCSSVPTQRNWISAALIKEGRVDVRLQRFFDNPKGCLIITTDETMNFTILPLYAV